jgi:hypothetical protein
MRAIYKSLTEGVSYGLASSHCFTAADVGIGLGGQKHWTSSFESRERVYLEVEATQQLQAG